MVNFGKSAYTRSSESGYITGLQGSVYQNFKFQKNKNGKNLCSIPRSCYDRRVSSRFLYQRSTEGMGGLTLFDGYDILVRGIQDGFITYISASTSTPKLLLSPRPNLTPFLSRETASATKLQLHYLQSCIDQIIWSNCTFILATYSVLRNKKIFLISFLRREVLPGTFNDE